MFKFSFLKLFARTIFYKILEYIFFFRSLKNCLKLIVNDNIDNFYAPNLFIKNIIFIDPMKIEYKNVRSCIYTGPMDFCQSGEIFPTKDICINPKLRV